MSKDFFPPRPDSEPTIYAYEDTNPQYAGLAQNRLHHGGCSERGWRSNTRR